MERDVRIAKGAIALYIASVITLVLNTAYFIILTNFLPISEVGIVSLLNIIIVISSTLSVFALPIGGSGFIATPPAVVRFLLTYIEKGDGSAKKVYYFSAALCASISILISSVISFNSSLILPINGSNNTFLSYSLLDLILYSIAQFGAYSIIGIGRAALSGELIIISSTIRYLFASLLLIFGYGVSGVFIGFSIGDALLAIISNLFVGMRVSKVQDGGLEILHLLPYMLSILVSALIGIGVTQVDKLLAFFQRGFINLGLYNVASVGASIASFAPTAITNVLVNQLSVDYPSMERRLNLLRDYTRYTMIVTFPIGFELASISPYLLLIFGRDYVSASPLLSTLAIAISLTSISSIYSSSLLLRGKAHLFLASNLLGLLSMLIISLTLSPFLSLLSIAIGRAAMLIVVLMLLIYLVKRDNEFVLDNATFLRSLLSSAIMGGITYSLLTIFLSGISERAIVIALSILAIPLSFLLYAVIMRFMHGFEERDVDFLEQLLPRSLKFIARLARKML